MKPSEKDREAAFKALGALIPPCWQEKASEHLAKYAAAIRAEGYRAGLERAARRVETWGDDDKCIQPMFPPIAAAIRALAGEDA